MSNTRREFIKNTALASFAMSMPASSYRKILGANDRIRVGCVGFSDRFKQSLFPPFKALHKEMNFELVGLSDIWNRRRDEGGQFFDKELDNKVAIFRNNDELYESKSVDAVFISTADFQHAVHTMDAIKAGCDVYAEKPLAETMADNRELLKTVKASKQIFTVGSQRRSGSNYHQAHDFIKSGEFGPIVMVELYWNVNQPGRWRRPDLVAGLKESDVDWQRFLINRPKEKFDPRKYLEYRLFWPYSSGIPGQWMAHQIDTVHWFSGLQYPRSVVANGGIYQWKDGRTNADTMAVTFDYGPLDDMSQGFQVIYLSRFSNSAGGVKELYFSNGGMINLDTNEISDNGGLNEREAGAMKMKGNKLKPQKLAEISAASDANMGNDPMTFAHVKNWMQCVRDRKQTNAPIEVGYSQSIATIMANAAYRTGQRVTFDAKRQEVLAGGKIFKY
ncbi:MAG TPA: Gfo/Idh/MocA family oxidoreductase [Saprospiraceae bacterium]|nr:Gfo/Idh/MocA family oxidoreductase [Saprospiraceae bacterium]